jgi:hypothetical protein
MAKLCLELKTSRPASQYQTQDVSHVKRVGIAQLRCVNHPPAFANAVPASVTGAFRERSAGEERAVSFANTAEKPPSRAVSLGLTSRRSDTAHSGLPWRERR